MAGISRRTLLLGSAGAAALVAAPFGWLQPALAETSANTIPRRDAFGKCVGSTFRMTGSGVCADVTLNEVRDLTHALRADDQYRFALLFRMPASGMPAGIFTFRHDKIGSTQLFVAPVDRGVKGSYHEAVVNRAS